MSTPRPQDTGTTTIIVDTGDEVLDEGVANGILSFITRARQVEHDEERGAYIVTDEEARGWTEPIADEE